MDDQLDPLQKLELAMLRAEHQKKFQVMIAYIKEMVGEGIEYRNGIVRVVVSETGAYYELTDLPEEFFGAVGEEVQAPILVEARGDPRDSDAGHGGHLTDHAGPPPHRAPDWAAPPLWAVARSTS